MKIFNSIPMSHHESNPSLRNDIRIYLSKYYLILFNIISLCIYLKNQISKSIDIILHCNNNSNDIEIIDETPNIIEQNINQTLW